MGLDGLDGLEYKTIIWGNNDSQECKEPLASVSPEKGGLYHLAAFGKNCMLTCGGDDFNFAQIWVLKHNDTLSNLDKEFKQMSMNSKEADSDDFSTNSTQLNLGSGQSSDNSSVQNNSVSCTCTIN